MRHSPSFGPLVRSPKQSVRLTVASLLALTALAILAGCGGNGDSIGVSISPAAATLAENATQTFTASVTGTSQSTVTWSATGGSITTDGVYTAPATTGSYTVTATSLANPNKSATATVTVTSS